MPNYEQYKTPPFDPRMAQQIQSNPTMAAEQGNGFMSAWGGPQGYVQMAHLPMEQRVTYFAIRDGITDPKEISNVTGLTPTEVGKATDGLNKAGLISGSSGTLEAI